MPRDVFLVVMALVTLALAGCPAGNAGVGDACGGGDDCSGGLQCVNHVCVPACERAPECGDGYRCEDHRCIAADRERGANCMSEVDCEAGLSCQINGAEVDGSNRLVASCSAENLTAPAGAACARDADCRNGTCELGHCVDLCRATVDCARGTECMTLPRVAANGALFYGCLPSHGTVTWPIPVLSASAQILLPVPSGAESAELVMSVDDPTQKVGVTSVLDPCGCTRYTVPCPFGPTPDGTGACTELIAADQFYSQNTGGPISSPGSTSTTSGAGICGTETRCDEDGLPPTLNRFRHLPAFGQSVLLMPSIQHQEQIKLGAYQIEVSSFWRDDSPGTAIPHITAVVRLGSSNNLDLHFFFADLADHPCLAVGNHNAPLSAATAPTDPGFQAYRIALRNLFGSKGLGIGDDPSYEDIANRHDLDALDVADAGALLSQGHHASGINVFFVRSLSPIGLSTFGPNPGPAGVAGTRESGIVIALDLLCYRDWNQIARLTAHQLARYMGLYHNVEPKDPTQGVCSLPWQDPVADSDLSSDNLLYFSEHDGTELSVGQREAISRSAALR